MKNVAGKLTEGIPLVEAVGPRQVRDVAERGVQVDERPRDDDVVIGADQTVDYQLTEPYTCRRHRTRNVRKQET